MQRSPTLKRGSIISVPLGLGGAQRSQQQQQSDAASIGRFPLWVPGSGSGSGSSRGTSLCEISATPGFNNSSEVGGMVRRFTGKIVGFLQPNRQGEDLGAR